MAGEPAAPTAPGVVGEGVSPAGYRPGVESSPGVPARALHRLDRWWDSLVPDAPQDSGFAWRRHVLAALGVVAFAGLHAGRGSLDGALAKVHPPDQRGYSVNELHNGPAQVRQALSSWRLGSEEFASVLRWSGRQVALTHTITELVMAPVAALLLFAVLRFCRSQLAAADPVAVPHPGPHRAVLTLASLLVVSYFVLGVLDQLGELVMVVANGPAGLVARLVQIGSIARRISLALILFPIANTLFLLSRNVWHPIARLRRAGSAYRVLVVLVVVHLLVLQVSIPAEQSRDAIRLWPVHGWLAVWGILATSCFSLSVAVIALRLSTLRRSGGDILTTRSTVRLTLVGVLVAAAGFVLRATSDAGGGIAALGIVLAVVGITSLPICWLAEGRMEGRRLEPPGDGAQVLLPAALAMTPLVALEIAVVRAGLSDLIAGSTARWLVPLSVVIAGLAGVAYVAARAYGHWATAAARSSSFETFRSRIFLGITAALATLGIVVAVWVVSNPFDHARSLGVHGILGVFLVVATAAFGSLGYLVEGRPLPAALDFLGLRRIPLVSALIAWALIGNMIPGGEYHQVRVLEDQPVEARGQVATADAFERWVATNLPGAEPLAPTGGPRTVTGVPLVVVTAAGGGIRAATFTASVVDCLFTTSDPTSCSGDDDSAAGDLWPTVFAASGASGGSVGLASVTAERALGTTDPNWVRDRLGTDLLSPQLAWQLLVEAPNALLGFNPGLDRAEVLERTWERRFETGSAPNPAAAAFLAGSSADSAWSAPLLFLNGTNLTDGCRVTISPAGTGSATSGTAAVAPGATLSDDCRRRRLDDPDATLDQTVARSLADYLCPDEDIALSTAAFLSARFPIVSPSGIMPPPNQRRSECSETVGRWTLSIGDGGYRDNTGAAAILDLWSVLEPLIAEFNRTHDHCIVPLFVEIDNGHRNRGAAAPAEPGSQLTAPISGGLGVFASRDAGPIEELAAEFSRGLDPEVTTQLGDETDPARFVRLSLYEHPGVLAPLGWSLSEPAVQDLTSQLDDVPENRDAVARVREWITSDTLTCTVSQ